MLLFLQAFHKNAKQNWERKRKCTAPTSLLPSPSLADPTRCPRQRRRRSRSHLSRRRLRCLLVVLITQAFVLIFCSAFFAFSRFVCLFCVFAKCFVVFRFFVLVFAVFAVVVLWSFLATLLFILHVFSLFNLRLLPVLVFGKLFSGSPDKNTHTIYQLGLEFSAFFLCVFLFSVFSLLLLLFRFFVVVFRSLLSHLSSFISIENVWNIIT